MKRGTPAQRIRALETERAYLRAELAAALAIIEVLAGAIGPVTVEETEEALAGARALLDRYAP